MPFEIIALEEWGGGYQETEPHLFLLTTAEEIAQIADYVNAEDLEKVQQVDFSTHAVIALFRGIQPGSKHDVVIQRIFKQDDGSLAVVPHFREPKGNETAATEQTSPYHLVKIAQDSNISAQTQLKLQVSTD